MNPGGGGGSMSYPGGGGGYPGGSSYGYCSQYMQGYHHQPTVPQSQASPYGSAQGVQIPTNPSQPSQYGGDQFNCKTPPFQSFQRPYSPTGGFSYGLSSTSRHGPHQHLQSQDPASVDLKANPLHYSNQNYTGQHQASAQYGGYNGFENSPHSSSTFSSPDPNKNLENFPDSMSRQRYDFFEKQQENSSSPMATPIDVSKSQKDLPDENMLADDLTVPRNGSNEPLSSSRVNERVVQEKTDQPELNLEGLDHLPLMHDLPELKADSEVRHSDCSPHRSRSRGLKRGLSPSNDTQDSESQDSYGGGQHQGMVPGHQDNEFLSGIIEGGMPHQFSGHMGYGSQHHMWNYYGNPYNLHHMPQQDQQQQHGIDQGFHSSGMSAGVETSGGCNTQADWWMHGDQGRGAGQISSGDYPPGFRMPFNMQAPGPWALRGPRPRGERRGPGRPRLNATSTKAVGPMLDRSLSTNSLGTTSGRSRMMSPGINTFSPGLGSASSSIPSPDLEGIPSSPGSLLGTPDDDLTHKRQQHPQGVELISTSPGGMGGSLADGGKVGKSNSGNKKRFTCEICQKRFSTAWYVRVHRKSHNGERPYTCDTCGKGFMLPNVLLTHKKKCERQNPGGSLALGQSSQPGPPLPTSQDVSSSPPPIGIDPDLHHRSSSPLPHHSQQQHFGLGDPFERDDMGQLIGDINRGTIYQPSPVSVQPSPGEASQYTQRYPGHTDGAMNYHLQDQMYNNRDYMGGNGVPVQFSQANQQPLSPQFSAYSPTSGGMRPPLGSDNSSSSGSSSLPPPVGAMAPNNLQSHFLGNDKPSEKGGGHGGRLVGGELPPVNKLPPNTADAYCVPCETDFKDDKADEKSVGNAQRPYSCEICDKRFSQKCNLITHKRIHTGERPHICPHCDKKFTQKGNLDAHLKTHSKEKPYPCGTCDKKFAHKTSLMSHFRQEHNMFDEIDELKQGYSKYPSSPSPSDFDTRSPINHHICSPGIPTPQSSLESVNGGGGSRSLLHGQPTQGPFAGTFNPYGGNPNYLPLNNGYPLPSPSDLSNLSKLTATVEATTMRSNHSHIFPPRSISSSSSASS